MMTHPELIRDLAREHRNDLIQEAERQRLLSASRRYRRATARRQHG
jgi:hypothetical protein